MISRLLVLGLTLAATTPALAQMRLAGVEPVGAVEEIGSHLVVSTHGFDRWGDELVVVEDGQNSLQENLLAAGKALCRPDLGLVCPDAWLAAEAEARQKKRGGWAKRWPTAQLDSDKVIGEYALVRGRVLNAQAARRYVYLNFGETWKTDFTVRIPKSAAKKLKKSGLDPEALGGATVEVRGFVFEENGPMIELHEAAALEVLP